MLAVAVRFGNVLASRGSVVRHLRNHIEIGDTEGVVERLDVATDALSGRLGCREAGCSTLGEQTPNAVERVVHFEQELGHDASSGWLWRR